jgi:hypothetical protein
VSIFSAAMPLTLLFCGVLLYLEERQWETPSGALCAAAWCLGCVVGLMVLSAPLYLLFV